MDSFTASAIQIQAGAKRTATLASVERMVEHAAASGARLVALPELFAWHGRQSEELAHAEPVPGPLSGFAAGLARRLSIYLVAGSILERAGQRCFNTCLLFGPEGKLLASYRKLHLFAVELPGKLSIDESATRMPGKETVCVGTEIGRIGLAICYDLRFPELFRRLSDAGAEILVLPSAFTAPTGRAHWSTLLRARAIENQCFLIAPNQFGSTAHGFDNYGHSMIIDPWGEVLVEAGEDKPCVATARLEACRLEQVRRSLPCLQHRCLRP